VILNKRNQRLVRVKDMTSGKKIVWDIISKVLLRKKIGGNPRGSFGKKENETPIQM